MSQDHDDADREPGTFTLAELQELAYAGVLEIVEPGTPEAVAFDRAMAAQLDQVDEELRRREGPDAVTSDRLLRSAAIGAERDPQLVGYALAAFCRSRGWERSDLA